MLEWGVKGCRFGEGCVGREECHAGDNGDGRERVEAMTVFGF